MSTHVCLRLHLPLLLPACRANEVQRGADEYFRQLTDMQQKLEAETHTRVQQASNLLGTRFAACVWLVLASASCEGAGCQLPAASCQLQLLEQHAAACTARH